MASASYEDTESPKNDDKPNIMVMSLKSRQGTTKTQFGGNTAEILEITS